MAKYWQDKFNACSTLEEVRKVIMLVWSENIEDTMEERRYLNMGSKRMAELMGMPGLDVVRRF